jgi:tetratricopeptide (TPR) repeat protein
MLQIGKSITTKDDPLESIHLEELFSLIKKPTEEMASLIHRMRTIRTIDVKQYNVVKRQLPYIVCGIFRPPYRRIENFGYIQYFIVDIDHINEKGLSLEDVRAKLISDSRVMLCFISPSEDGLKVLFHLSEKCHDSGKYSLFYKTFARKLSQQYDLEQVIDTRTSDVSRACFLSEDEEVYFNPEADAIDMKHFINFENLLEVKELQGVLKTEEKGCNTPAKGTPRPEPGDEAIEFIKQRLKAKTAARRKPQVYVPEQLEQILENLLTYIKETGVEIEDVSNIQYGKKFKFRAGLKQAEVNLFFGKRGFSVVKSPRNGTSSELNDLMVTYIQIFIDDYILIKSDVETNLAQLAGAAPMSDYEIIRQQANLLTGEKNYLEALPLYRSLWEGFRENCNEWDGWRYADCLKQLKDYQRALEVCREVYLVNKDFEPIKRLYAWCIYYTEMIKEKIQDEDRFFKAGMGIMKISRQNDQYSPYTLAVFKILNHLNEKPNYPADKIAEWTEKLNPEQLDATPFAFTDKDGNQREIASKKEQYYMWRTKALLEKGLFDECRETCQKALDEFEKLHYGNEIWFTWRIALCYEGLEKSDIALEKLIALLDKKKEWFIQKEIAGIYFARNDLKHALKYAVDSALNSDNSDKKLNLYKLLAGILKSRNQIEEASKHIELVYHTKRLNDHRIDEETQRLVETFQIDITKNVDMTELKKELKNIWEKLKYDSQEQLFGVIKSILPNGKAGFVETGSKQSYYFQFRNFKGNHNLIEPGQKVTFFLEDGFDIKKNRKTKNAINVKPQK